MSKGIVYLRRKKTYDFSGNLETLGGSNTSYPAPLDKKKGVAGWYNTGIPKERVSKLEQELNLLPKTLEANSRYWADFRVSVDLEALLNEEALPKGKEFDLSDPYQELQYYVLTANKHSVATSPEGLDVDPGIILYFATEVEEAKKKNGKRNVLFDAIAKLKSLTDSDRAKILGVVTGEDYSTVDKEIIDDKLGDLIEANPQLFMDIAEDKNLSMKELINKAVSKGVIKLRRNIYYFEEAELGKGIDNTCDYLSSEEGREVFVIIQKRLSK